MKVKSIALSFFAALAALPSTTVAEGAPDLSGLNDIFAQAGIDLSLILSQVGSGGDEASIDAALDGATADGGRIPWDVKRAVKQYIRFFWYWQKLGKRILRWEYESRFGSTGGSGEGGEGGNGRYGRELAAATQALIADADSRDLQGFGESGFGESGRPSFTIPPSDGKKGGKKGGSSGGGGGKKGGSCNCEFLITAAYPEELFQGHAGYDEASYLAGALELGVYDAFTGRTLGALQGVLTAAVFPYPPFINLWDFGTAMMTGFTKIQISRNSDPFQFDWKNGQVWGQYIPFEAPTIIDLFAEFVIDGGTGPINDGWTRLLYIDFDPRDGFPIYAMHNVCAGEYSECALPEWYPLYEELLDRYYNLPSIGDLIRKYVPDPRI